MSVELIDSMGDDLRIVNAARVSYAKHSAPVYGCQECGREFASYAESRICGCPKYANSDKGPMLSKADTGLINYLMRNRHGTPFEMVVFTFRVRVPIAVAREWQRHRIGSFNETSTRYVEVGPDFYQPPASAVRSQVGKPGHYRFEPMDDRTALEVQAEMREAYDHAYERYRFLIERGVAKELARNVLPLGLLTSMFWCVNLRSLLNFLSLRTHPTALLEIREEAQEIERLATAVVPVAMAAWNDCGRVAP